MRETVLFSEDAVNIFFHILTRCNLSCRHCYINPAQHGRGMLSLDTIEAWLSAFADLRSTANVIFLGGEPTLHPKLPEAVRAARRMGYHSITIDTNGYLFHDCIHRLSPADVDFISFSLDGATQEINDTLRGKGSYDTCLAGVKAAVARGFHTSMIYTVSDTNVHELPLMADLVPTLGIKRFFIQVLGIRGNTAQSKELHQVTKETWEKDIPETAERIAAHGIPVTFPKVFLSPDEPFACAGTVADNYFIFPNGRVYKCPLCEDYPLHGYEMCDNQLTPRPPVNETDLFNLTIPEGCVMNKLLQQDNIDYDEAGKPVNRISCCLIKNEIKAQETEPRL